MPHKNGDSSVSKPGYVGSYGEHRLLTDKDLAGFYSFACHLRKQDTHNDFLYVGLGRSPVVLMEFMRQFFNIEPLELPLSVSNTHDKKEKVALDSNMRGYIARYLPPEATAGRTVVLVDYVDTGDSLVIAYELVQQYLREMGQEEEAERVLMAPIGILDKQWNDSLKDELLEYGDKKKLLTLNYDYKSRAAYHMIKVLHFQIDKEGFSPFPRVRFTDIRPENAPKPDPLVQKRLHDVVKLALSTVDEDHLQAPKWLERKSHSARKPNLRSYNQMMPTGPQYRDRLASKSATYYDIYSCRPNFIAAKLAKSVWAHRHYAVLLLLMICALLFRLWTSGSPSSKESSL